MNPVTTDTAGRSFLLGQLLFLVGGLAAGLFPAAPASGTDLKQPAQLQLTIVDEEHQPLPAARVWSHTGMPAWPESSAARTPLHADADGRVALQRRLRENAAGIRWRESLRIELDGFVAKDISVELFPGARRQVTVMMLREHMT